MSASEAGLLFIAMMVVLFFMRPLTGNLMDALKIMITMCSVGLILHIIPLDFLDDWSKSAGGWANMSAKIIPVIAMILLVALSTVNVAFLSGSVVEQIIRWVLYVVGGVFTVGSKDWIAFARAFGDLFEGLLGVPRAILGIFLGLDF